MTKPVLPEIAPATVIAMAQDPYLSKPALDDPLWCGADESARSVYWGEWAFCWSPDRRRISAQYFEGDLCATWQAGGAWEEA